MGDLLAYGAVIEWCKLGLWINLLGFSVYHSRGDVWLPTPPTAINFLTGMVLTATLLFATVFLLISCLTFFVQRVAATDNAGGRHFLDDAFYGDGPKLLVKYLVFFLSSFVMPLAIYSIWKMHPSRLFTILSAFGIMLALFIVIVLIADLMFSRSTPRQVSAKDLRATT